MTALGCTLAVPSLRHVAAAAIAISFILLVACSGNDELPDSADAGEQQMYEDAQRYLRNRNHQGRDGQ